MVAIARKNVTGTGTGVQPILGQATNPVNATNGSQNWSTWFEQSQDTRPTVTNNVATMDAVSAGMYEPFGKGWHFYGQTFGASPSVAYFEDAVVNTKTAAFSDPTYASLLLFGQANTFSAGFYANYDIAAVAVFNTQLTRAQISQVRTAMIAEVSKSSITLTAPRLAIGYGDSIMVGAGATSSYFKLVGVAQVSTMISTNFAITGSGIASGISLQSVSYPSSSGTTIKVFAYGANDNAYGANWLADYAAMCDAERAKGFKVLIATVLPNVNLNNTTRATWNTELRLWATNGSTVPGKHCDGIIDFAADATMGPDGANLNATNYQVDHIHPTDAGHAILQPIYSTAIGLL